MSRQTQTNTSAGHFFVSGKRLPCLHEQVSAPLRSVLNACHWHAASFVG